MKNYILLSLVVAIGLLTSSTFNYQQLPEGDFIPVQEKYVEKANSFKNGLQPLPKGKIIVEPMPLPRGEKIIPYQTVGGTI